MYAIEAKGSKRMYASISGRSWMYANVREQNEMYTNAHDMYAGVRALSVFQVSAVFSARLIGIISRTADRSRLVWTSAVDAMALATKQSSYYQPRTSTLSKAAASWASMTMQA